MRWHESRCGRSWELKDGERVVAYVARSLFGHWVAVVGTFAVAHGDDAAELRRVVESRIGL